MNVAEKSTHTTGTSENPPMLRVMALHALSYCKRLFYLEEVEEIRVADARVYAGRTMHEADVDPERQWTSVRLESETWGLHGKVDFARYRDGVVVPYEHKRGYSARDGAWPSDALQIAAYAVLLEEHLATPVPEGRVHYHADNRTIRVPIDDSAREWLRRSIHEAHALAGKLERPPVATNPKLCGRCSLAPVCLPEEERLAKAHLEWTQAKEADGEVGDSEGLNVFLEPDHAAETCIEAGNTEDAGPEAIPADAAVTTRVGIGDIEALEAEPSGRDEGKSMVRLFPKDEERQIIHVLEYGAKVGREGQEIVVRTPAGDVSRFPGRDVAAIVAHGAVQISSQLIHYTEVPPSVQAKTSLTC